jgi:DNA-binding transcriptional LysR family regulator
MDLFVAMRVFRRVVELQGFAAAARDLRMSNAAVSKSVVALERRLRTKLLHRTTRSLSLTPEGASYYQRCAQILDDVVATERSFAGADREPAGVLRVNAPMSFGLLHVSPLLPALVERFPNVRVELELTDRFVDLVEEAVDVVVRIAAELPDSATLTARRLSRARQVLCASPDYLRRRGAPRAPDDLAAHECLVYSGAQRPGEWLFQGPRGTSRVRVAGRFAVNNSVAIRDLLLQGVGISLIPAFYVQPMLESGALEEVSFEQRPRDVVVHAVHQRSPHVPAKVRAFIDLLRERFERAPWTSTDAS